MTRTTFFLLGLLILTATILPSCAAEYLPDLIHKYQTWDAAHNDGKGNSAATTSGGLGWGEASFLRDYVYCLRVTRDPYWADKIVDHFDRMVENLKPNTEGFLAWDDPAYSVSIIETHPAGNVGEAKVEPALQRVNKRAGVPDATGHTYEISVPEAGKLVVRDVDEGKTIAEAPVTDNMVVPGIEPGKLTLTGTPPVGARWTVKTTAPARCEYQVHDGMVTYRIAQFVEMVLADPELSARYGDKGREYLALLDRHFLRKWEATWVDLPDGAGLYKFTDNPTQRFPGYSLPHNQYLALARTWLVLKDISGYEGADLCLRRATAMARYFKQNLRLVGDAYEWNYWDPLPHEEGVRRSVEDYSHATIDIGFAIEAAGRGVVFDETDLTRFASTYVDVMWNQKRDHPRFGARVNTNVGDDVAWADWIELGVRDERAWELAQLLFLDLLRPTSMCPTICEIIRRRDGVPPEDLPVFRERTEMLDDLLSADPPNASFEVGTKDSPLMWQCGVWSEGGEGSVFERVQPGHTGDWALKMTGRGTKVNQVAQSRRFSVEGKARVKVSAWYRTEETPAPMFSLMSYDAKGERLQYDYSPKFAPAREWTLAQHEFPLKEGASSAEVLLRNGAVGTVHFDDVAVEGLGGE